MGRTVSTPLRKWSRFGAAFVAASGLLVLLGWALDIEALKTFVPGLVTMKANTAASFVLLGVALWLVTSARRDRAVSRIVAAAALVVGLVGAITVAEYVLGRNLGIDQLLAHEAVGAAGTSHPGRMAPHTAACFVLLAAALLLSDGE
ncbi:MAG: PAS domain-containing sensor histidine kinase, partial [Acidobacteriota bacterium]